MRNSNWERANGPAWGLDLGRGIKGRNEGLGLVPQDKNQEEGNGAGVTKIFKTT